MKTYIFSLKKASQYLLFGISSILISSCGSYQNSSYYDNDGIYGDSTNPQRTDVTQRTNQNNPYKEYFNSLQTEPQSDQVFTDVESYNNFNNTQNNNNQYAGWGNNHPTTDVNIYSNNWGWGMTGWGYNNPYYGWGYNNFGWNSPYYGFNNFGWNSPYAGWGYGGFGFGFNNFGWNSPYYGWGYGGYGYNYPYYNYNSYDRIRSSSYDRRGSYNSVNSTNNSRENYSRSSINNSTSRRSTDYNSSYNPNGSPVFSRSGSSTTNRIYTPPTNNNSRESSSTTRSYNSDSNNNSRRESSSPSRTYSSPSYSNDSYSRPSSGSSSGSGNSGSSGRRSR